MSAISQKSISGITSISSPAGIDDQISLHTSNTNEALKIDGARNLHLNNHVNTTGVTTASNFKTGSSNLHNVGIEIAGVNVLGADTPIGAGATIFNSGDIVMIMWTHPERTCIINEENEVDRIGIWRRHNHEASKSYYINMFKII